jgi:transcriptional antiterminator RfaH
MLTKFQPAWYVLYTKPLFERKVAVELENRKFNVFLPTRKETRKWHDRKKVITIPLFPSYIFVFLEKKSDYFESMGISGVLKFVKFGDEIARVDRRVIENLRCIITGGIDIEVVNDRFEIGRHVTITQGLLNGLPCEIADYKNDRKVIVRVNLLNRSVLATIPSLHVSGA